MLDKIKTGLASLILLFCLGVVIGMIIVGWPFSGTVILIASIVLGLAFSIGWAIDTIDKHLTKK